MNDWDRNDDEEITLGTLIVMGVVLIGLGMGLGCVMVLTARHAMEDVSMSKGTKMPKVLETVESVVPLHEINVVESVQSRSGNFNEDAVGRYMAAIGEHKDVLPPVILFTWNDEDGHTDQPYFVGEGFNRLETYRRLSEGDKKHAKIKAIIHVVEGGRDDAKIAAEWCSIKSNAEHGLPRSQADRRRAIKLAIGMHPDRSCHWVAQQVRVDEKTVKRVHAELNGLPDPYAEAVSDPIREPSTNGTVEDAEPADPLENVKAMAAKTLRDEIERKRPLPAKRVKELEPVTTVLRSALDGLMLTGMSTEPEIEEVVNAAFAYLQRCGVEVTA